MLNKVKDGIKGAVGEVVLKDDVYDEFRYFSADGRDQDRYKFFRVSKTFFKVDKGEYAIVVNRLNPNNVQLLESGTYPISVFSKYIFVPRPEGPMYVDFTPSNEEDKKNYFTFTPGVVHADDDGKKYGQDEIFIDYKICLNWVDPLKYFYSANVMHNIQSTIVSLLRQFVSKKDKSELMSNKEMFDLKNIDPDNKLFELAWSYGLELSSFEVNNIKFSDAVQNAKNEAAVRFEEAKGRKKVAEIDRETAKINAEASVAGPKAVFDMAEEQGYDKYDSQVMTLQELYAQREIAKTAKNVFLNAGSSNHSDARSQALMYGGISNREMFEQDDEDYAEEYVEQPKRRKR